MGERRRKILSLMNRLYLHNVSVRFGHTKALEKIDIDLPTNGVVALVGPNGAGKSTLLDVLSGFVRPSAGCITEANKPQRLTGRGMRRRFSRLHQRLVVPSNLQIREFLFVAARPDLVTSVRGLTDRQWCSDVAPERMLSAWPAELLEVGGLSRDPSALIGNLSYGQKRIVALAAVLLSPKPGILLDEPLAGLSGVARAAARDAIIAHGRQRLILLAEHDLDTVREMADELVVLVGGKTVVRYSGADVARADLLGHFLSGGAPCAA